MGATTKIVDTTPDAVKPLQAGMVNWLTNGAAPPPVSGFGAQFSGPSLPMQLDRQGMPVGYNGGPGVGNGGGTPAPGPGAQPTYPGTFGPNAPVQPRPAPSAPGSQINAPFVPSTSQGFAPQPPSTPMFQPPPTGGPDMLDFIRNMSRTGIGNPTGPSAMNAVSPSVVGNTPTAQAPENPYSGYTPGGSSPGNAAIMNRIPQGGADAWNMQQWQQAYQESMSNPYLANTVSAQGIQRLYNDYISKGLIPDRNAIGLWMGGAWLGPQGAQGAMVQPGMDQVSARYMGPQVGTGPGGPPGNPNAPETPGSVSGPTLPPNNPGNGGGGINPGGTFTPPHGPGVPPGGNTPGWDPNAVNSGGGGAGAGGNAYSRMFGQVPDLPGRVQLGLTPDSERFRETQSVDQLGGVNSAFFNNMMQQLAPAFAQRRAEGLAAAKEASGNLTGSGYANALGSSINRSLGDEQAMLANYASQGMNTEIGRQLQMAGLDLSHGLGNRQISQGVYNNQGQLDQQRNLAMFQTLAGIGQGNAGNFNQALMGTLTGSAPGQIAPTGWGSFLNMLGQLGGSWAGSRF